MYSGRRMHSDISLGFLGPSSTQCPSCTISTCRSTSATLPRQGCLGFGGDDLPAPAPAPAAVIVPLPAPPAVHPAPPALHDHSWSPSPPAPHHSTHQHFEPCPLWISNAPLVPIHHDPPHPPALSASPAPAPSDQESYHLDSEDEQGTEIVHQVWGSVLEAAGIYPEYVEMEIDDAWELAFLLPTKHMLHLESCQCQRPSSRLWQAQRRHSGRRHASKR